MEKVDLSRKLASFDDTWKPRVVAELNGQQVKVAKLEGEYVWHSHAEEDELFWVLSGRLAIHFRDRVVELEPGQLLVVPRGVEHKPVAEGRVECALFEPATTRSTGDVDHEYTVEPEDLEHI
jgi:mannose-6-phosphate isomerase-like protein (cupin superfamily)